MDSMMASSKQIRHIATNPQAHMRFLTTGRLPDLVSPRSPLIDLLLQITPRDRAAIVGLTVNPCLGYSGSRQFHTAEQALRWVRPEAEMLESQWWPAKSWLNAYFSRRLSLEMLLENASSFPQNLIQRYPQLCDQRPHPPLREDLDTVQPEAPASGV